MSAFVHARKDPITGQIYEISYRCATYPDDVPLDEMPSSQPGTPLKLDGRRAVPDEAAIAARQAQQDEASLIEAEKKLMAIERLELKGTPLTAAKAAVNAEIASLTAKVNGKA